MSRERQLELVKEEYTISLMNGDVKTTTETVDYEGLKEAVLKDWSPATFQDNYRKGSNFLASNLVVLDIDEGMTIDEARKQFDEYKYVIATSRSHQIEKNGKPACDRFRVVLFLAAPISDKKDFQATLDSFLDISVDTAALEPARRFYPCTEIVDENPFGDKVPVVKYIPKDIKPIEIDFDTKGQLARATLQFLTFLAPTGRRHDALIRAAVDACEQGFTMEEFIVLLEKTIKHNPGVWEDDELSDKDLRDIEDMYSKEEYALEKRLAPKTAFNFQKIFEIEEHCGEIEWLLDESLIKGGISILAADPKAGKSTLARQLSLSVARGETFLGKKVEQGTVLYFAVEEQSAVLANEYRTLGITNEDPLVFNVGAIQATNPTEHLDAAIKDLQPSLVVIDTLQLFTRIQDINSYTEVNKCIEHVREIARQNNCHILMTHHTNKSDRTGPASMTGSKGLWGAVDCILLLSRYESGKNYLTSSQRTGTGFDHLKIAFNKDTKRFTSEVNTYELDGRKG